MGSIDYTFHRNDSTLLEEVEFLPNTNLYWSCDGIQT